MPRGADYEKKRREVENVLDEMENRKDIVSIVAYMKQVLIEETNNAEFDEENAPKYDAIVNFIGRTLEAAVEEGGENVDYFKQFIHEVNKQVGEAVYQADDCLEDIEEQIRKGEMEDAEFFADDPQKTEELARAILLSRTDIGKDISGAMGIMAVFGTVYTNQAMNKEDANMISEIIQGKAEGKNIITYPASYEAEKVLRSKPGMTKEKIDKLMKLAISSGEFYNSGYAIKKRIHPADDNGKIFDSISNDRIKCSTLNQKQLAEEKLKLENESANINPNLSKERYDGEELVINRKIKEVELAQKHRALDEQFPEDIKDISSMKAQLFSGVEKKGKLKAFEMKINNIKKATKAAAEHLARDRKERGTLDPKSHAQYLKLCEATAEFAALDPSKHTFSEITRKLRELKEASDSYYNSHKRGILGTGYKFVKGAERQISAKIIKMSLDESFDSIIKLNDELAGSFYDNQKLEECFEDLKRDQTICRKGIKRLEEKLGKKAALAAEKKPSEVKANETMSGVVEIDISEADVPGIEDAEPEIRTRPRSNTIYKSNNSAKAEDDLKIKVGRISVTRADVSPEIKTKSYAISSSQKAIRNIMESSGEINAETKAAVGTYMAQIIATCIVRDKEKTISTSESQAKIDKTFAAVEKSQPFKNMMAKANTDEGFRKLVDKALTRKPNELMVEYAAEYAKYKEQKKFAKGKNGEKLERTEQIKSTDNLKNKSMK